MDLCENQERTLDENMEETEAALRTIDGMKKLIQSFHRMSRQKHAEISELESLGLQIPTELLNETRDSCQQMAFCIRQMVWIMDEKSELDDEREELLKSEGIQIEIEK
uniref:Uncharacterized protein n=1 Tax=Panagrolaimus sp. JU765 TaxID=591449 RepID=A0AC34Q1M8_9BILA